MAIQSMKNLALDCHASLAMTKNGHDLRRLVSPRGGSPAGGGNLAQFFQGLPVGGSVVWEAISALPPDKRRSRLAVENTAGPNMITGFRQKLLHLFDFRRG